MLENIKQMILEKKEYLEASQLIFEGTVESDLDDLIVLNEDSNYNEDGLKDTVLSAFGSNMSEETKKFHKYYGKYIRGIQKQVSEIFSEIVSSDSSLSELSENKAFFDEVRNAATKTIVVRGETITIFDGQQSYKNGSGNHDHDVKLVAKAFSKTAKKLKSDNNDVSEIFKVWTGGWIGGHENDLPGIELSINTPSKVTLNVGGENKSFKVSYEDKSYKDSAASLLSLHMLSKKENLKISINEGDMNIVVKSDNVLEISGEDVQASKLVDPSIISKIMKRVFGENFEEISVDESFMEASHNTGSKKPKNGVDTMKYIDNVDNDDFKEWFFKTPAGSKLDAKKFNMKKLVDNETTNEVVAYYVNDKVVGIIQSTISGSTQKINICAVHPKHKSCLKELVKTASTGIADKTKVVELCKKTQKEFISAFKAAGFIVSKDAEDCTTLKMDPRIKNKNESVEDLWSFFEADNESETSNTEDVTESDSSAEEGSVTDSEESGDVLDTEISSGEEEPDEAEGETDADGGLLDTPVDDGSMDNIADYGAGDSSFDNEPTELSDDDILSVTIDLKSNTMTDVLPIPPDNAGEAVNDDILSTRVDSGFDETNIQSEPPAVQTESSNSFLEGITLGGDGDSSDEDNEPAPDEEPADENEVTSAVKDKVAEAESEEEPLVDDGEDLGSGDSSAKEALMKKLSSITKSLEDAKNAVLKSL